MILLVTSAAPGEGKSTMSIHLAKHFASVGKRDLLIEADLRCPVMSERCEIKTEAGLTHYLAGVNSGYNGERSFSHANQPLNNSDQSLYHLDLSFPDIVYAVKNVKALKHCKVIWVNKRYKDLPAEYKKAGVAYIQNSNACISAGGGRIWSCSRSKGYKYRSKSDYYRSSGYPFNSRILVVIVPEH